MRTSLAITLALLFSHSLLAAESEGISFDHKDWEMVCDNAHTCRAAGYGVEENAISVLLTRRREPGKTSVRPSFSAILTTRQRPPKA